MFPTSIAMPTHLGRSFTGTHIEDACPCETVACGLVADANLNPDCDQHPFDRARTIRQLHRAEDCPALHTVAIDLEARHITFSCSAAVGYKCRLTCSAGCEVWSFEAHEHPLVDGGECMLLPWLNNLDWLDATEAYVGDVDYPPARSGPVILTFVDEWVEWRYSDEQTPEPVADIPGFEGTLDALGALTIREAEREAVIR